MNSEKKALILDFGGVISRTMFETHDLTEQALGLPQGTLTWRGPFAPEADTFWQDMQARRISERDYWLIRTREVGALVGKPWTRMEEFVVAARGADPASIIRPEFHAALAKAKSAGILLGILSNELDLFYGADFRKKLPFLADFDAIVDATYSNILKPDPRSYASICDALGMPPHDCVFVDDQLKNIEGAMAFGMTVIHFDVKDPQSSYREALAHLGLEDDREKAA
jgi:putative hydrolase of the HAD superfamily